MKVAVFEAGFQNIADVYIIEASNDRFIKEFQRKMPDIRRGFAVIAAVFVLICAMIVVGVIFVNFGGPVEDPPPTDTTTPSLETPIPPDISQVPSGYTPLKLEFLSNGNGTSTVKGLYDYNTFKPFSIEDNDIGTITAYMPPEESFICNQKILIFWKGKTRYVIRKHPDAEKITEVVIPDGIKIIPQGAFFGFENLERVTLPEGLETIENYAFYQCHSLKSINFPDSLKSIGECAFAECSSLEKAELSGCTVLENIGKKAFADCTSLQKFELHGSRLGHWKISFEERAFENCRSLKTVRIESEAEVSFKGYCFAGCASLAEFDSSNAFLWDEAVFFECTSIETLKNIECSFTVPLQYDYIADFLFGDGGRPERIKEVCWSVIALGDFGIAIETLTVFGDSNNPNWMTEKNEIYHWKINAERTSIPPNRLLPYLESVTVITHKDMRSEDGVLFYRNWLILYPSMRSGESYSVPRTTEKIAANTFINVSELSTVIIPKEVAEIGKNAFIVPEGKTLTVYCEAAEKPQGWDDNWISGGKVNIIWGYSSEN